MIVVLGMLILVALTGGGLMQDKPIFEAIQQITVGDVERFLANAISILALWVTVWIALAMLVFFAAWMWRKRIVREFERRFHRDKYNA